MGLFLHKHENKLVGEKPKGKYNKIKGFYSFNISSSILAIPHPPILGPPISTRLGADAVLPLSGDVVAPPVCSGGAPEVAVVIPLPGGRFDPPR